MQVGGGGEVEEEEQDEVAEEDDEVVVVDRGGDKDEHGRKGVDGGGGEGQPWRAGQHHARDAIGQVNRSRPHQQGEETDDVNRQHRPAPGECFALRIVNDQVDVAIRRGNAIVDVGVEIAHLLHVRGVDP